MTLKKQHKKSSGLSSTDFSFISIFQGKEFFIYFSIFLVAFVIRAVYLWEIKDTPVFSLLMGDSESYDSWAMEIYEGNWLGNHVFYQSPFYPYFLAIVYSIFGRNLFVVRLLQILLGATTCLLTARAGRYFFSKTTGIVSGFLLAVYPTAIFFNCQIQKATFGLFFMALLLFLAGKAMDTPKSIWWILIGMVLGCFGLTRENALILIPIIFLWLVVYFWHAPKKNLLLWCAAFILGMTIVFLPVSLRNKIIGGEFVLTTSQFGSNFYIGNKLSSGTYVPLRWEHGDWRFERTDATELAEKDVGHTLSPSEVSRYWTKKTLSHIRSNPIDWLKLLAKKWFLTWNATEISDTESQYAHYEWSVVLNGLGRVLHFGILCPLAVFGLCVTFHERKRIWLLYCILIGYAVSVSIFYVFSRYRFPLVAVLVLFSGAGLIHAVTFFQEKKIKSIIAYGGISLLVAIIINWTVFSPEGMASNTYYNVACGFDKLENVQEAVKYYSEAIQLNPNHAMAQNNMGIIMAKQGRPLDAIDYFSKAIAIKPDLERAHNNLGIVLAQLGRDREAINHFIASIRINPDYPAHVYYNIACLYARLNETEESIDWLNKAISRGFNDWDHIKADKDLDNIRSSSYYEELIKDH